MIGSSIFRRSLFPFVMLLGLLAGTVGTASAAPMNVGPETCKECHRAEVGVWENTPHAKSFKGFHKSKEAKAIAKAVGDKSPKRSDTCVLCHYTLAAKKAGGKVKPVAGPSCESCHGAASDWVKVHNDYGGPSVKRDQEAADHKATRVAGATAAGMLWPSDKFGVVSNCMECHGLSNEALSGETVAKMLDAGHPIKPGFEVVQYSQGVVRHRFYPPNMTENKQMSPQQLAELFVVGQAAALVSATAALSKSDHAKYQTAQNARIAKAKDVLSKVPEAAGLLANPSADTARALVAAIAGKDLSGAVGGMLPAPGSYK